MKRLTVVEARFWRMLRVRYQHDPLSGEGALRYGGRWNRRGIAALYLATDHTTAIAEFWQRMTIPGTLVAYDIYSSAIADLTDGRDGAIDEDVAAAASSQWSNLALIEGESPAGWRIADHLIEAGAHGALIPSAQNPGGTNLVLWRWSADGAEGARVRVIDPESDLRRR